MAKLDAIIGGLEIAKKYFGGDRCETAAEHDQFFICPIEGLTEDDAKKLIELGWLQDDVEEPDLWDPKEGWYVFT